MPMKLAYGTMTVARQGDSLIEGATYVEDAITAPRYRLFSLDGFPVLVEDQAAGGSIAVQLWDIPDDVWKKILELEPPEMVQASVELEDSREVETMLGTPEFVASNDGIDVSEYGSWAQFLGADEAG